MKKLLLATAVAALSVSAAHAAPTVYGKALVTVDYSDFDDESSTQLNSTGRIGFKGAEALTANTDVVYQLEYGIDVDADEGENFRSRDTYIGLSNKQYGTLVAGRLSAIDDNINYVSQTVGQYDSFNAASWDGERVNNAMAYFSPAYNGLQFMGMYAVEEDNASDLATDAEAFGVGVKYEPANQPFRAGATYIKSGDFNTTRLSGAYDLNNQIGLGALYQISDLDTDDNENLAAVSATYKTATPWTAYAQAEMTSNVGGVDGDDAQRLVLGGKYAFKANATGHVYAGYSNLEQEGQDDKDGFGIGTGIEYKF
ncbi:porin [Moraxella osloensis]|uniref:Porin n=1 Tax=Faucicola osloensis TaxID=34062 RepID=A0AAW6TJ58_FAUOS|nr:porin [Moraxella osloensis]MDI4510650.1 porin [Moraxella osloensis]